MGNEPIIAKPSTGPDSVRSDKNYSIIASSYLDSGKKSNYKPECAVDFDSLTAWVEGCPGYGFGEWIGYILQDKINTGDTIFLKIRNGYAKSAVVWEANSRLKKAGLYKNSDILAVIDIQDISAWQLAFYVSKKGFDFGDTLKLVIHDIYKGRKFKDTAVSDLALKVAGNR